jgi:hypothetical protein
MKNVRSPSAKRGAALKAFFIAPEPGRRNFLFLADQPRKSLDVPVKWVMKNTNPAAALPWLAASERFSSP